MHCRIVVLGLSLALSAMTACSPIVDSRGHGADPEDFKQIVLKQSTTDDVRAILGSPTAMSNFGQQTWYYISERKERDGPFAAKVTDHHVYAIHFDANHVVADMSEFDKDTGKQVEFVEKTTPTEGNEMTFTKQLFGNFGRFGAPGRSIDPRSLQR